ncbi:MAG: DUF3052 domain-containing protein [Alphaproteobacteria bacterium]|nr:DUF3052 domain-containing protein [Alphaproteobacteria bacterium]
MAKAAVGYSGTPLLQKLGYKPGLRALLIGVAAGPEELADFDGFASVSTLAKPGRPPGRPFDLIHIFEKDAATLEKVLPVLVERLELNGAMWVSWPKKASKVPTTITEDVIRSAAFKAGLVDVKVCAVDEVWSGLKLVIPVARRRS